MSTGTLVLAATPIGDPRDAAPRSAQELATADVVAAEDTRRLRRLLTDARRHAHRVGRQLPRAQRGRSHPGPRRPARRGGARRRRHRRRYAVRLRPRLPSRRRGGRGRSTRDVRPRAERRPHGARRLGPAGRPVLLRRLPPAQAGGARQGPRRGRRRTAHHRLLRGAAPAGRDARGDARRLRARPSGSRVPRADEDLRGGPAWHARRARRLGAGRRQGRDHGRRGGRRAGGALPRGGRCRHTRLGWMRGSGSRTSLPTSRRARGCRRRRSTTRRSPRADVLGPHRPSARLDRRTACPAGNSGSGCSSSLSGGRRPVRPRRQHSEGARHGYHPHRQHALGGLALRGLRPGQPRELGHRHLRRQLALAGGVVERQDEPRGAHRGRSLVVLLDGAVQRSRPGRHAADHAGHHGERHVRPRHGHHRDRAERRRRGAPACRRRTSRPLPRTPRRTAP